MRARVTLNTIPLHLLEWLTSSRLRFLSELREGGPMRYFSAHLPVMATWREGEPFPVNLTVKGLGLLPRNKYLQYYTDMFEAVIAEAHSGPWDESLERRIDVMSRLYGNIENFEPSLLGGLEIFEGKALENMRENPHASLLYVGVMYNSPVSPLEKGGREEFKAVQYISFQINGDVEILDRDNPYYKFLLTSRRLFEFDKFHIYQPDYPFGYLIKVVEVRDKSPWSRSNRTSP